VTLDRATLVAGDGGAGFSPTDGRMVAGRLPCRDNGISDLNRKRMVLRASDGGKGGTIRLMAKEV
jgi:hypothetical protein